MRTEDLAGLVLLGVLAAPAAAHDVDIDVLSSRADQVSGGDALVRSRRGTDTPARASQRRRRDGRLRARGPRPRRSGRRPAARPQPDHRLRPLAPRRQAASREPPDRGPDLLRPAPAAVRLQDDPGRARRAAGRQPGRRRLPRARARRQHGRLEPQLQRDHARRLALPHALGRQVLVPLPAGPLPADVATTTTLDGRTVPFVVRRERGTINRFIYSLAMLADPAAARDRHVALEPAARLLLRRRRGDRPQPGHARRPRARPGPARPRLRDRPLERDAHERPLQHGPRRRDGADDQGALRRALRRAAATRSASAAPAARSSSTSTARTTRACSTAAIPTYSYPDMVTQTIHVGDCELLEHYMDVTDAANPKWQDWDNREWLEGLNAQRHVPEPVPRPARQQRVRQRLARAHAAGA